METVLGTMIVFGIVVGAMSLGALVTGRPLKGSCGGPDADCPCSESEKRACELKRQKEAA
ncbi:MAG: hypothetical protein QNK05_11685 [Myxococcota bacterium]|nr:hypothetical protein [Myxococcota bacterium]